VTPFDFTYFVDSEQELLSNYLLWQIIVDRDPVGAYAEGDRIEAFLYAGRRMY
jgi:hypothetical protein